MDVPSPVDLRRPDQARTWADTANTRRPWRADFFSAIVAELRDLRTQPLSVLELGSGPGFLAAAVLRDVPNVDYTLLDHSPAMHDLARARLVSDAAARYVVADFKRNDWSAHLSTFDAVVTVQAVHELRHKRHAADLHRAMRTLLRAQGIYLVCDHVVSPEGMTDTELYMTVQEHADALGAAGFSKVERVLERKGLVLHSARAK